ncbi:hypothetical protein NQ318_005447 [Aromia moschata]|uniref:Uncharacterized protein n=1 Tax=Aromia moschata TaxID=1265417 RepID=A0AAV8YYS1_9CUCU|nr:hypothetical protein NQ318_005447 [Aromia moschata]
MTWCNKLQRICKQHINLANYCALALIHNSSVAKMSDTWPVSEPRWVAEDYEEVSRAVYEDPKEVTVKEIIENSEKFPVPFPIESVRCKTLIKDVPENILEEHINSAYPVVHEQTLNLYARFLRYKRKFGSEVEKSLYENLTIDGLVDRLLRKRAVVFVDGSDYYMLLDGHQGIGGWETIGTSEEREPLLLKNYLSYDEIKLSALLSISSSTNFINDGRRVNRGIKEEDSNKIETRGIIVGLIGARLEKPGVMEYQELVVNEDEIRNDAENRDLLSLATQTPVPRFSEEQSKYNVDRAAQSQEELIITEEQLPDVDHEETAPPRAKLPKQNVKTDSVEQTLKETEDRHTFLTTKQLFLDFYGEQLPYNLENSTKFAKLRGGDYFNNQLYEKRLSLSIDTLLIEANARAEAGNQMAFVYVVGIGLGVWKRSGHQDALFMETFAKRINFLSSTLTNIADICFSYIKYSSCGNYQNGNLLVVSYAWDGNALPGNEFWMGQLAASGDPAAASSTQIAELHNPHINPRLRGAHLQIATLRGLVTLGEYILRLTDLPKKL